MPQRDDAPERSEADAELNSLGKAFTMWLPFGVLAGVLSGSLAVGLAAGPAIGLIFHALRSRKEE